MAKSLEQIIIELYHSGKSIREISLYAAIDQDKIREYLESKGIRKCEQRKD